MNQIGINSVLVFLIIVSNVEGKGDVTFWRDKIKLTCPEKGDWYKDNSLFMKDQREHEIHLDDKVSYYCQYKENGMTQTKYSFYVKGRGCENCYEVDRTLVAGCIVGDLMVTGGFILIVYLWAKKKSRLGEPQKKTSLLQGHVPGASDVHYEPLRLGARGKDIYATNKNETK
ncbi:hypothetical protein DPEC_G00298150 [Dallia pectoralis]|uniref:Uncharacterized protein n=1 Tax=Dallia pectoralis TaxID=75939 RepID=A0ACC2FFY0_DALPE|nr:hypothetical protein DPEC_G00298150 [Dallia pectoralis]